MRAGRIAMRTAIVVGVLVALDQGLDRLVLGDGMFLGRPVAPFDPPLFSSSQKGALRHLEEELKRPGRDALKFDSELGWCNRPESGFGEFRYDWAGARIGEAALAREKTPGRRRVVAVGCSMTHGEEVAAKESWCARVDALLPEIEVANLGVAAYGLDQALLRLRRDGWPLAPDEVWLGVLPQAALRVTTRFRPLLDHWSLDVAFKPRFVLDAAGGLVLEPNPAASVEDVPRLLHDQAAFLQTLGGDTWVARAPLAYAPRGTSWMHASFAARVGLTLWERAGRDLEACFAADEAFGRLYTTIVRTMAAESAQRKAVFRLIVLPGKDDLLHKRSKGRGYWEDWADRLRNEGLNVLDLSGDLLRSGNALEPLYGPEGHYTAAASELVARALATAVGK